MHYSVPFLSLTNKTINSCMDQVRALLQQLFYNLFPFENIRKILKKKKQYKKVICNSFLIHYFNIKYLSMLYSPFIFF
jgi:arylamine N-acetyltransferase